MDPATIGLLISIAPTVLDLLFGRGNVIKHEFILENPKEMYGYGLEGYGYRYPPIEGYYYEEPITLGTFTRCRLKGKPIKRYPPKVDEKWVAAYLLNKLAAKENKWREFATKALRQASKEYQDYLETLKNSPKREDREAYVKAVLNRRRKEARKGQLPLALRSAEGKKLFDELSKIKDDKEKLLQIYYKGKKPRKPRPIPEEVIQEILGEEPKKV
jgi:hypothetical protein